MTTRLQQLLLFLAALLMVNIFLPSPAERELAGGFDSLSSQPVTVTYQKEDDKGLVSETDDSTITNKAVEERPLWRPLDYQGEGGEKTLDLKRIKETSGGETIISTQRILVKFPNIIGSSRWQIPAGSLVQSAKLKLILSSISAPENVKATAYQVLENWIESDSGYLKSPSWRQRHPSTIEEENHWKNFGADSPASSAPTPLGPDVVMPRIEGSVVSFDITEVVQEWSNGKANNGVMIKLFDETLIGTLRLITFYSSEWPVPTSRPLLEVTYAQKASAPPPPPPSAPPPPTPAPTPIPLTPLVVPPPTPALPAEPQKIPRKLQSLPAPTKLPEPAPAPKKAPAVTVEPKQEPVSPTARKNLIQKTLQNLWNALREFIQVFR